MEKNYNHAEKHLKKIKTHDKESLYMLSLLYRMQYRFIKEKQLMESAISAYPKWRYAQKRIKWHDRPMFEKMVPRKPLHLPRDPHAIPQAETLAQLCFVTGADANYYTLLVELIESIKATRFYKNIPICIYDLGLTEDQKKELQAKWGITDILDPGFDLPVQNNLPNHYKALSGRVYMAKHFPKFRFHLWIDSDMWVHDECALDRLICLCEQQGWAMSAAPSTNMPYSFLQKLPWKDWMAVVFKKVAQTNFSCIDKDSQYAKLWQTYFEFVVKRNQKLLYGMEENAANFIYYTHHLRTLNKHESYPSFSLGNPIVWDNDNIFYDPILKIPVGIMHLFYHTPARHSTHPCYYFPTFKGEIGYLKRLYLRLLSMYWHFYSPSKTAFLIPDHALISLRYRVWPNNTQQLQHELNQSAQQILQMARSQP